MIGLISGWRGCCHPALLFSLTIGCTLMAGADVSQTISLATGSYLSLDTGLSTTSKPGANDVYDLQWTGTSLVPQGKARTYNAGTSFAAGFDNLAEASVRGLAAIASASAIPNSALVVNDVIVGITNFGNAAKLLVVSNQRGTLELKFVTFVTTPPNTPSIKTVVNNSSQLGPGLPNSGIAPSSIFVITGSLLADPGAPVLQSSAPPGLPSTLNGASVAVTVNGVTTNPALYYTSPGQLAAVMPANTPVGTGTITVTYNGKVSAAAPINVVASAVGINTYGANSGVATDAVTGSVLTYSNSGAPGQTIVLWTTGLGADPADSDTTFTSTPHAVNTPLVVYVGGIAATILYQGSSGYPGVNQINIVIPDGVPTGCWIPLAAVTGTVVSNVTTLPINKGGGACSDAVSGLNGSQLFPGSGVKYKTGLVSLIFTDSPASGGTRRMDYEADAAFETYTGLSYDPPNSVSPGGCILLGPAAIPGLTGLDPGKIHLTGPAGLSVDLASQFGIKGAFAATLPAGAIPSTGGSFTFTGTGGADVGAFSSTITLANPLLTWTNPNVAGAIDKTRGLQVTWTGGNPGTFVNISGSSSITGGGTQITAGYRCLAAVEAGQFTVPSYILLGLPNGNGGTLVQNLIDAPLTASGLDIATAAASVSYSVSSTYSTGAK
jgi:uncharacterized protein (TIGR03437 family)